MINPFYQIKKQLENSIPKNLGHYAVFQRVEKDIVLKKMCCCAKLTAVSRNENGY
jgi:hypothetical protein